MKILFYIYIILSIVVLVLDFCFKILTNEQRNIAFYIVIVLNIVFAFLYRKKETKKV